MKSARQIWKKAQKLAKREGGALGKSPLGRASKGKRTKGYW